jgi:DNA sulfur modification protein DndD
MRLVRARIENFKLLEDIRLEFSTDPAKPLTVIRAENGSGKTSLLYALLWAFYGMAGLPEAARMLRLTSSAIPAGTPVDVSVMVEFEHTDDNNYVSRYRLIRSVVETPTGSDKPDRPSAERVRLLKITPAGEKEIEAADALIGKLIPLRLRDVFFTNGDAVQTFISGHVSTTHRQAQVHKLIRALLGLEALRTAVADIDATFKRLRGEAAKSGGADTSALERALEVTESEIALLEAELKSLNEQLKNMTDQKIKWDKELGSLRGIGDLDELNERIDKAEREKRGLETTRSRTLARMSEALRSESCSWALLGKELEQGVKLLSDLADRRIIPGAAVQVLTDRLELEECICGESLKPPSPRRDHVERLRDEQLRVSENRQRLSALFYTARQSTATENGRTATAETFPEQRSALLKEFTDARDALSAKGTEVEQLKERRKLIDEARVRDLTEKIAGVEAKIADANTDLGEGKARLQQLKDRHQEQETRLRDAQKAAKVRGDLAIKRDVAQDLLELTQDTLKVLEGDYVHRVSDRMAELFMGIVGSHPDFEAAVFTGVHIDDNSSIVVDTHGGRHLDTDFELNGASQRALTLSFIWALMEVSGTTAPRIIDTPLGMVSGGVKTRMVDSITLPSSHELPDFQVVLFMTRSEIRDIEDLLDERAGIVRTLSNSHHYPEDLVYSWHVDHPMSRLCNCTHRQSCRICARRYDERHGIDFRDVEATV